MRDFLATTIASCWILLDNFYNEVKYRFVDFVSLLTFYSAVFGLVVTIYYSLEIMGMASDNVSLTSEVFVNLWIRLGLTIVLFVSYIYMNSWLKKMKRKKNMKQQTKK